MHPQNGNSKNTYYTYLPVLLGMFFGCIIFLFICQDSKLQIMNLGLEDYKISAVMNLPVWKMTLYVLKRRLGQWICFFAFWYLFSYSVSAICFNTCFGLYYGMVMCDLFIKFGWKGMVYGIACFFPHYILVFLAIWLLGKWFYRTDVWRNISYGNVNELQYFVKIFVIFFLIFVAIVWEIKFQKNILNFFYQYLV